MLNYYKNITLLTGDFQVGKSTIIDKYLDFLTEHRISFGGIRTFTITENGCNNVYIIPASFRYKVNRYTDMDILDYSSYPLTNLNLIGDKNKNNFDVNVFDTVGVDFLINDITDKETIIIDEIGFIENESIRYKKLLFDIFENDTRKIVGVIRKDNNKFMKEIKKMDNVEILEVTKDNRDMISDKLLDYYRYYFDM